MEYRGDGLNTQEREATGGTTARHTWCSTDEPATGSEETHDKDTPSGEEVTRKDTPGAAVKR